LPESHGMVSATIAGFLQEPNTVVPDDDRGAFVAPPLSIPSGLSEPPRLLPPKR
jgi:hypothetical protein